MSRSRRKTPITGITMSDTEKWWKQLENRRLRRTVRRALVTEQPMPDQKAFCDPWLGPKDGKQFFSPDEFPNLMRK